MSRAFGAYGAIRAIRAIASPHRLLAAMFVGCLAIAGLAAAAQLVGREVRPPGRVASDAALPLLAHASAPAAAVKPTAASPPATASPPVTTPLQAPALATALAPTSALGPAPAPARAAVVPSGDARSTQASTTSPDRTAARSVAPASGARDVARDVAHGSSRDGIRDGAPSVTPPSSAGDFDCLLQPNQIVQVGVQSAGVLEHVDVDRGDAVQAGQLLARLTSSVEQNNLDVARSRALQQADIRAAERSRDYALREVDRARGLVEERFISSSALDKAQTEADVSIERVALAREHKRQSDTEVRLAQAQLERRLVRSPIAGIVTDRFANPGEFVEARPVLRIVEVDPLRVESVLPASWFGRIATGDRAVVRPQTGPVSQVAGTVTVVDQVLDPASNTFRVRLKVDNPARSIPAGSRCRIEFGPSR